MKGLWWTFVLVMGVGYSIWELSLFPLFLMLVIGWLLAHYL
ncbi:hypothetical protein [Mesorhizobium sp. CAU 1741]